MKDFMKNCPQWVWAAIGAFTGTLVATIIIYYCNILTPKTFEEVNIPHSDSLSIETVCPIEIIDVIDSIQ